MTLHECEACGDYTDIPDSHDVCWSCWENNNEPAPGAYEVNDSEVKLNAPDLSETAISEIQRVVSSHR